MEQLNTMFSRDRVIPIYAFNVHAPEFIRFASWDLLAISRVHREMGAKSQSNEEGSLQKSDKRPQERGSGTTDVRLNKHKELHSSQGLGMSMAEKYNKCS